MGSVDALMMLGAFFALVMALGQLLLKNHRPANKWLILLLLTCFVWIMHAAAYSMGYIHEYPHLNKLHVPFLCLTGPLWYKYIYCLHEPETDQNLRYHLIYPVTATVLLSLPFYLEDAAFKLEYIEQEFNSFANITMYMATRLAEVVVIVYCMKSMLYMKKAGLQTNKKNSISTTRILWVFSILAIIASTTRLVGSVLGIDSLSVAIPTVIIVGLLICLYLLSHRQPVVLGLDRSGSRTLKVTNRDVDALNDFRIKIQEEKWYLDPDLKLQKLARKLGIPPNNFSELINQADGSNFNEFINKLRIEHAQSLMRDNPKISNDAAADLSGFNSRSVFYKKFKDVVGETPTAFKKELKQANGNAVRRSSRRAVLQSDSDNKKLKSLSPIDDNLATFG